MEEIVGGPEQVEPTPPGDFISCFSITDPMRSTTVRGGLSVGGPFTAVIDVDGRCGYTRLSEAWPSSAVSWKIRCKIIYLFHCWNHSSSQRQHVISITCTCMAWHMACMNLNGSQKQYNIRVFPKTHYKNFVSVVRAYFFLFKGVYFSKRTGLGQYEGIVDLMRTCPLEGWK